MNTTLKVIQIIREQLGFGDENPILESDEIVDDLGADSLNAIEIVMSCEDVFGIQIHDEKIEEVKTVSDAINLVQSYL